jgi:hypothetical protein
MWRLSVFTLNGARLLARSLWGGRHSGPTPAAALRGRVPGADRSPGVRNGGAGAENGVRDAYLTDDADSELTLKRRLPPRAAILALSSSSISGISPTTSSSSSDSEERSSSLDMAGLALKRCGSRSSRLDWQSPPLNYLSETRLRLSTSLWKWISLLVWILLGGVCAVCRSD